MTPALWVVVALVVALWVVIGVAVWRASRNNPTW